MKTKQKLAQALTDAKAPAAMIKAALSGRYDDFESNSATPIHDLVKDCQRYGLTEIAQRAVAGDFDATKEEAKEWMK